MSLTGTKVCSKYVVGPKIGSGSFGEVYVVNLINTTEIYALKKVLLLRYSGRWEDKEFAASLRRAHTEAIWRLCGFLQSLLAGNIKS